MTSTSTPMLDRLDPVLDTVIARLADPALTDFSDSAHLGPMLCRDAGLALLFAELGHGRFEQSTVGNALDHRRTAHRALASASQTLPSVSRHGLYDGVPALAFAANTAVQRDGEYATMLGKLDEVLFPIVRSALDTEYARLRAGRLLDEFTSFDVITGLAGVGRCLLRRCSASAEAESLLREILDYIAALVRPVTRDGISLPGWWVESPPTQNAPEGTGHLNLGLAHGIPGPLALLSTAWRTGVRIDGHAELIGTITDFLLEWSDVDEHGRYWPGSLTSQRYTDRSGPLPRARQAWCYGTPGVARAVQLAGLALNHTDWLAITREAVRGMFDLPQQQWGVQDATLCHGWAGLLHVLGRIRADDPDSVLDHELDWLADRTLAFFAPEAPYGYPRAHDTTDSRSFLMGSTGIALALLAFRDGQPPASGWDAALLLH